MLWLVDFDFDLTTLYLQECVSKIMLLAKKFNVPFVVDGVSRVIWLPSNSRIL